MDLFVEEVRATVPSDRKNADPLRNPLLFFPEFQQHQIAEESMKLVAISKALGTRDKYTEGHGQRVSVYATRLATRINLPEADIDNVRLGGLLHDIGKIIFSDRIFSNQAAKWSRDMHKEIQSHPCTGRAILENLNFAEPVLDYVYYHHERVDGHGYPCGLSGREIPLGARIISVADCFDAMTTDRPYQSRKCQTEAVNTLKQMCGKMLCPEMVGAFIEEIVDNGIVVDNGTSPTR